MNTGWIKVYRELLTKPIWKESSPERKTILITILLLANHAKTTWTWKGQQYVCRPGQLYTSLDALATASGKGISIQNVRSALKKFEAYGFLTNESTMTGRLITITNWEYYQKYTPNYNKDFINEATKTQQRSNKDPTPNNNDKNVIKPNNERSLRSTPVQSVLDDWRISYCNEGRLKNDQI